MLAAGRPSTISFSLKAPTPETDHNILRENPLKCAIRGRADELVFGDDLTWHGERYECRFEDLRETDNGTWGLQLLLIPEGGRGNIAKASAAFA